ncbi:hypothetical protein IX39_20605 [Chryseobacterium formosense]|uniref:Uncharacterized protein n=1 Tax=Chryseobacterium formosense TaxID=236814 RepID=A0A085YYD6_9FLAO|nr:hypothetical protein [Chryseobacterium formosense]KFE97199.1 hypothetical protein IX39_20605 [Chryseobacterium formosense]SFT76627.1 hypothetical protein SAMN05421857_3177 [Chryseobacterium formosense]
MKIKFILVVALASYATAYSQVGINTDAPNATLDVVASAADITKTDGFIAPRLKGSELKLKDALYASNQTGAIVYITEALLPANTTTKTVNVTTVGYFYFDGAKWVAISGGSVGAQTDDWHITGNTGTAAGTNFLGTTDDVDLIFKRKNIHSGWINENLGATAFGVSALPTTSTGLNNSAFGISALSANTTGYSNAAFGNYSLAANTTGVNNSSFGAGSLLANSSGYENSGFGFNALRLNTTGVLNSGFGSSALSSNTTGESNTAVGTYSLLNNTNGDSNIGVGFSALHANTSGSFNTALGINALSANITANFNTAIGFRTMRTSSGEPGSNNVALGAYAYEGDGGATDYGLGSNNTVLGGYSGRFLTGSNNTFLGYRSGYSGVDEALSGSNNIIIGNSTYVPSATASNQLNIGNAIFGTGMSGSTGSPAGNIGIGKTAPTEKLEVAGAVRINSLPANGALNAIYTQSNGLASSAQNQTFTATRTVVADANGVLGSITGVPLTSEVDGVIGNEVLNATTNKGLVRVGAGTSGSPYTLGLTDGGTIGQTMIWNGTSWAPGAITASNGLTASAGNNIKLGGTLSDTTTTIATNNNTNALAISGLGTVAATDKLLALDASNRVKTVDISSQFDNLGIPRPAVFQLTTSGTYLSGVGAGGLQSIPMSEVTNKTGATGVTFTSGTNTVLLRPGLYQITFVYESTGTNDGTCSLSSYFVDFPNGSSGTNRIHSTAAHNTGGSQNHGGAITYTSRITGNTNWQIQLGRGVSGNCSTAGTSLKALSTQVSILKLE